MTFVATIDEHGQVSIPSEVMESLRLEPGTPVELEIRTPEPEPAKDQPEEFDAERFKRWFDKYRGIGRAQFLAEGYTSIEEYVNEMRGR
jgi:AbrB family looped-hinge helix DNA binding protein